MPKKAKLKKCVICKAEYSPLLTTQKVCSIPCAQAFTKQQNEKKAKAKATQERRETRAKKEALKPLGQHKKEAQAEFNKFIRLRDINEPCISCGKHHQGQYHAGHYRSVGAAPELRFNEQNVHKQCSVCNNHLSGNLINYRINLINKIGLEAVEELEGKHEPLKLSVKEVNEIKRRYRVKWRELEKQNREAA